MNKYKETGFRDHQSCQSVTCEASPKLNCGSFVCTVLALKSGYYLDGKEATLISAADDIRILAYIKARGD
jgi:hypothetical protein